MKFSPVATILAIFSSATAAQAQEEAGAASLAFWEPGSLPPDSRPAPLPPWLEDRGEGVHTSMFGSYVRKQEFVVYLFYEYTYNHDSEYKPSEFGYVGDTDYTAKRVDHEALVWAGYGITEDLMVEFECALWTTATQNKSSADPSAMPKHLTESGLGDTEGQIRWRFLHETEDLPEALAFFEYVLPLQRQKVLIGTQAWEFALGVAVTKGFSWGTLMAKVSYSYLREDTKFEFGEYGIEYVKKLSDQWRLVLSVEGDQDEVEGIVEFQWKPWPNVTIKINNGFGITSKAPDWAPEIGVMISF